ncbi:DUF2232 domain-containing protein [Leptolyngbya sp. PCC 6406]|uniref:DUF2232 domain-containing protein n=1 Tax=Leptolyngbya sp. PCC 6406 TaxID=1173264 RepID=UPI0002AC5695|nr:DUF2232 domain-containing protein [Leptolyngbya sp. PCC 6406]
MHPPFPNGADPHGARSDLPPRNPSGPDGTDLDADEMADVEAFLDYQAPVKAPRKENPSPRSALGPLPMVETAFLASAASLIWLVNTYFPPGPLLRIIFPLPMALVYLRWGSRAAWMSALVATLLLAVMMGPPRSLLFLMPYGLLGVQLGWLWRRRASWYTTIGLGALLSALGVFVRLWLLSIMLGEDLWIYTINQVTQLIRWVLGILVNWGWLGWGVLSQVDGTLVQILAMGLILVSSVVYLFTVHLAAWLLLERLGEAMSPPPLWVQRLLDS